MTRNGGSLVLAWNEVLKDPNPRYFLLLLHGRGADEEDLAPIAPVLGPARILSVRAPYPIGSGYQWYDNQDSEMSVEHSVEELIELVDQQSGGLPVVVLGFSQGGLMATALALQKPLKAIITLSAPWYHNVPPASLQKLWVFWGHGTLDSVVPLSQGLRMQQALIEAGAQLTAREYSQGHTITMAELDDIRKWLSQLPL